MRIQGWALDWCTGERLRVGEGGRRGWIMQWDPVNGRWVAENPGAGFEATGVRFPARGEPNSYGYDERGVRLPYANQRPKLSEKEIRQIWEQSKQPTGGTKTNKSDKSIFKFNEGDVIAQNHRGDWYKVEWKPGQKAPRNWQAGHVKGQEYWRIRDDYMNGAIDEKDFLKQYHDLSRYEVQDPLRNASHIDEAPR